MVTRVLSGMRPTGRLHIGHLVGALDNWVVLQEKYEDSLYFVADWHAITTQTDTTSIKRDSIEMAKDWIAAGINPDKSTIFIQSQVPQHSELYLVFSMLETLPRLERLPTFRAQMKNLLGIFEPERELTQEEIAKAKGKISHGFLGYPLLQAADILIYKADGIPVGEDQLPHLELTREVARTFNRTYGEIFPEPEALLTNTPRILGTDGRKMSKSYGNAILPTDSLNDIEGGVKKMITDTNRIRKNDPGNPNVCSIYDLHLAYTGLDRQIELGQLCRRGEIGCKDCKLEVASNLFKKYDGHRVRRESLEGQDNRILQILMDGSSKARRIASETMREVREHMMYDY